MNPLPQPKLSWALDWLGSPKLLYAGGKWTTAKSGAQFEVVNPANGKALACVAEGGALEVEAAVASAANAFRTWRSASRKTRSECLRGLAALTRAHTVELATLESLQNGKTFRESMVDDLPEAADVFDYYAGWTDKIYGETVPTDEGFHNFTVREPVGVCGLIVPWNFPLLLACWKLAPALAMGNTVVIKPSPYTPLSLLRWVELVAESGLLPTGVLNLILGGAEAGQALSQHPEVAKLSFTGSTAIGKAIAKDSTTNLKTVTLELGGKSANLVFADHPDLKSVVARSFTAMFTHKGEKCSGPSRFLVDRRIYGLFLEELLPRVEAVRCGDPFDPATDQGPQCHAAHFQKVMEYLEIGKKEGAEVLAGGKRDSSVGNEAGYFVRPTVFGNVQAQMRIAQEEIFGPVVSVLPFDTEAEAIAIANSTIYGLAAGVYTGDLSRGHRVAHQLEAGMVFVNHYGCYDFASPFGGFKQSGWGKEMAIHSLEAYTRRKSIWFKYGP